MVEEQKKIILVVDDDEGARELVRRILQKAGYVVVTADSGLAAIKHVEALGAILALMALDMVMPVMNGTETYRVVHEMQPGLPCLVLSGACERRDLETLLQNKNCDFLGKPFKNVVLLAAIERLIYNATTPH